MNKIRILNKDEYTEENEIVIKLDNECKLAFNIDMGYIATLAMENLLYEFDKNARVNRKSLRKFVRIFGKHQDRISDIISENVIDIIEILENMLNERNESVKSTLSGLNEINLEVFILSIISNKIIKETFDLLR